MLLGDLIQQTLEQRAGLANKYDRQRLGRLTVVGFLEGPVHHYYYTLLDKALPGMDLVTVSKKIFLDQTVASPTFIAIFFYCCGLMEGKSLRSCTDELGSVVWTVYLADWMVWPPTQFLNFYFIPSPYRVFYINAVTMFYNVFLSYMKHRGQFQHNEPVEPDLAKNTGKKNLH